MAKISADQLKSTVQNLLNRYGEDAENVMAESVWKTAGWAVKELKKGGSFGGTGAYNRDWHRKLTKKRLFAEATVYNRSHYYLTHLLEHGHAKQSGGRTKAYPHIAPVNDQIEGVFIDYFTDLLSGELLK